MTKLNEIYKCNVCGNIVEMVHAGEGELVCCGQPMELQIAKTQEEGTEKHQPVIKSVKNETLVQVGSIPHPMTKEHHIEWIEILEENDVFRKFLEVDEKPEKSFDSEKVKTARAFCNIHGLWKN